MAVVEGTGDHGCEYMTGGVAVVIGRDRPQLRRRHERRRGLRLRRSRSDFPQRCNLEMVDLEPLAEPEDLELVRDLLDPARRLHRQPRSPLRLLNDWDGPVEQVRQGDAARLPPRPDEQNAIAALRPVVLEMVAGAVRGTAPASTWRGRSCRWR